MNDIVPLPYVLAAVALAALGFTAYSLIARGPADSFIVAHLRTVLTLYTAIVHRLRHHPSNRDPLPAEGPTIVVANHRSGVDPVVLGVCTRRRIHFLMAREYYEKRALHWFFRAIGAIPVNRDGHDLAALKTALKLLRQGCVIGIFPQGGIRDPGRIDDAKPGVALLALRSGAPVVPTFICGSPGRESVLGALLTPSRTTIYWGQPRHLESPRPGGTGKVSREELEELTREVLGAVLAQAPEGTRPEGCTAR